MPLFDADGELTKADTHVDSLGDVLSDAGSTPAASTTYLLLGQHVSDRALPRLQHISNMGDGCGVIQQPNRPLNRRRAQVHVALRRGEVLVPRQVLDGSD